MDRVFRMGLGLQDGSGSSGWLWVFRMGLGLQDGSGSSGWVRDALGEELMCSPIVISQLLMLTGDC